MQQSNENCDGPMLKSLSDSISEGLIFRNFLPSDPSDWYALHATGTYQGGFKGFQETPLDFRFYPLLKTLRN